VRNVGSRGRGRRDRCTGLNDGCRRAYIGNSQSIRDARKQPCAEAFRERSVLRLTPTPHRRKGLSPPVFRDARGEIWYHASEPEDWRSGKRGVFP